MPLYSRVKSLFLFFVITHLCLPSTIPSAEIPEQIDRTDLAVFFDKTLRPEAEEIVRIYPLIKEHLEGTLRWRVSFKPIIVLIKEGERFRKTARNGRIVAYAVPRKQLIVIDYSRMLRDPFQIEVTLRHELCHLLLHHHLEDDRLPKWLDEGVAQWISGGIGELVIEQKEALLNEAVLTGRLLAVRSLVRTFPRDEKFFSLAYQESRSLVEYIVDRFGRPGLVDLLGLLKDHDFEEAVQLALSVSFDGLEEGWQKELRSRLTWFTFLAHHIYEVLFFLGALIMMVAFVIKLARKRAYMREEEDDFRDAR